MRNDDGFVLELILVAICIVLNGFFAAAEIAVITARRTRLQKSAQAGNPRAKAVLRLHADPDRFLATVQIGVTLVGTLASAVGGVAAIERVEPLIAAIPFPFVAALAEPIAVGLVVLGVAFLSLLVGELVPKSLAVRHADRVALFLARPIEWVERFSRPAVAGLTAVTGLVLRLLGQRDTAASPFHTLDDIRAMVDEAEKQGLLDARVLKGAVEFEDREARHLMTPRGQVVSLAHGTSIEDALRVVRESGYSRLPVHASDPGAIDGVVHARDIFEAHLGQTAAIIDPLVRAARLVPESKSARDLLAEMRDARQHLVVVVDEHGVAAGIVTLEDLLESIVGTIGDEHDEQGTAAVTMQGGDILAEGYVAVRDLNRRHGLNLPESADYATIAGLMLKSLGRFPRANEAVLVGSYRMVAITVGGKRIETVRIEDIVKSASFTAV